MLLSHASSHVKALTKLREENFYKILRYVSFSIPLSSSLLVPNVLITFYHILVFSFSESYFLDQLWKN